MGLSVQFIMISPSLICPGPDVMGPGQGTRPELGNENSFALNEEGK